MTTVEERRQWLLKAVDENEAEYNFLKAERPDLDPRVIRHLLLMEALDRINASIVVNGFD